MLWEYIRGNGAPEMGVVRELCSRNYPRILRDNMEIRICCIFTFSIARVFSL